MSLEAQIENLTKAVEENTKAVLAMRDAPPEASGVADLKDKVGDGVEKKPTRRKTKPKKADKGVSLEAISEYMVESPLQRADILGMLAKFGVKKASDLTDEQRPEFLEALKGAAAKTDEDDDLAA